MEGGLIRLHVFPDPWGLNPSPFCLKAETYCRLAGVPYRRVVTLPVRAPRGKLPFIEDAGMRVADSGVIIEHLKRRFGDPLDGALDDGQRAIGHLIRRTCEESLYFVLLHARWIDAAGWQAIRPAFFGSLPPLLRDAVAWSARRGVRQALYGQGYGRHGAAGLRVLGAADLTALATVLADRPFALGARPTSTDATLYGLLANILDAPVPTSLAEEARHQPVLAAYTARMRSVIPPPVNGEAPAEEATRPG